MGVQQRAGTSSVAPFNLKKTWSMVREDMQAAEASKGRSQGRAPHYLRNSRKAQPMR